MNKRIRPAYAILFSFVLLVPAAQAKTIYCCKDNNGRDACADILPAICSGRAYREINERGMVVKRVDAPLTAAQIAQKEADLKKAKEEEKQRMEQDRKNRALLATYSNEKDIDYMRERALAEPAKAIAQAQGKYEEALKKQKKLAEEAKFYKNKDLPPALRSAKRENDDDLKTQPQIIADKKKEMETIKSKYDGDKNRYRELTTGKRSAAPPEVETAQTGSRLR